MKVSIIIPARDEEASVKSLLRRIWVALVVADVKYEVVIVDDSDDHTAEIAKSCGAKVVTGRRLGLAQAVVDGIDNSDGDYIIVMDADLQHPPEILPQVIKQLRIHDLVVVSKHTKDSHSDLSWWRKVQSDLGCFAAKMLVPVSDPMTGFFGIRRACLDGVKLEAIGFKIGLEIFCKANWTSHCEVPMSFNRRQNGYSKGTLQSLQKHLWRLYKSSLRYRVSLPKGCDEWNAFYEGNQWHRAWKRGIAEKIQAITSELHPDRTLDCGCGSSPNINYIVSRRKTGIDIHEDALNFMRGHSDAEFVYGNILSIPFPDSYFDCVVCSEVIEHLYERDIGGAASEIARVMKADGYAVIVTPNYSSFLWNLTEQSQRVFQPGRWVDDHHTKFNRKRLMELCGQYGLKEIRYDGVVGNSDMVVTFKKENA